MAEDPTGVSGASRAVLGRGSLYTLASAGPVLAAVAVIPFVTRLLGPAEYGVVAISIVLIQVGTMVAGLGMAAAITRQGILGQSGVGGARSLVLQGSVLTAGVLAVAAITAPWWLPPVTGVPWRPALPFALAAAGAFAVVLNAQALLRVLDRPLPFVALAAVASLGGPVVGLVLLHLTETGADGYMGGLLVGYATAGAVGLVIAFRGGHPRGAHGDLRDGLRLGLPMVPHQVALYLANGALVLVAANVLGTAAAGRLQIAVLLGSAPAMVTAALNNAWAPVIYRTEPIQRGATLARTARDVAAVTTVLSGGVALLAPWLLQVLAPASYAPTELVAAAGVVAIGSVLSVAYLANVQLVFAAGHSTGLALVSPLSLGFGLLVALLASATGELSAVAAGFPATYLGLVVGTAILRRRVSPVRWSEQVMALPLLAGIAVCGLGAILPATGATALFRLPLAAALAVAFVLLVRRVWRRQD